MTGLRDMLAVLRRRSWLWEPAAIILVGLLMLWLCAYLYTVVPEGYFDFACANARLDQPFQLEGEDQPESLRSRWDVRPRSILDVGMLPAGAVAGSGTAVVTSDDRLVFGVREKTFIAGRADSEDTRHLVHFVAEGLQPWDVDSDGDFSPRHGAYRALNEELHVSPRSDAIAGVGSMVETGFSFDHKRWQPYFTFLARITTSWDDLYTGFRTATDAWESDNLWSLPFDIEHRGVRLLLLDRHPEFLLASNHAKTVLWFALLYEYGYHKLRDELTAPDA